MNFLWLLGLVCMSAAVHSQGDLFQAPKRDQRRKFCGKFLADTLSLVCGGIYNEWTKRNSIDFSDLSNNDDYNYEAEDAPAWPLLPHQAASLIPASPYRRFRRGVYDECCRKPCSVHELRSYCGH